VAGEEEHSCRRAYIVLAVAAALALMSAAPTFACSSNFYSTSETTSENEQGSSAYQSAWSHEDTDNTEDALCIALFLLMPLLGKLFTAPKAPRKPKGIYDWALERPG
jgi:hypothetical protein